MDNAAKTIASRCENEVVVDIGGGAAIGTAPELLKKLGCTVHTINENPSNTGARLQFCASHGGLT